MFGIVQKLFAELGFKRGGWWESAALPPCILGLPSESLLGSCLLMSVFVMPVGDNRKGSSAFGISVITKVNNLSSLLCEKSQTTTKGNKTRMCQVLGNRNWEIIGFPYKKKRLSHYFLNRGRKKKGGKKFLVLFSWRFIRI